MSMRFEHVRVATIRPEDTLCDAHGNTIGEVVATTHPSPMDYDKTSEFTLALPGGERQDFKFPAGVRVWRKAHQDLIADHPHTDPGDARTECNTCGKWVFECIHSCKGVPVTAAAWKRFHEANS